MQKRFVRKPILFFLIGAFLFLHVSYEIVTATSQKRPGKRNVSSATASSGAFAVGVALSPDGGQGRAVMKLAVASGAKSLVVGIGGMSLREAPQGAALNVRNPQGRPAEQVIKRISIDKGMESQMKKWAAKVKGQSRLNPAQLTEAKVNEMINKHPLAPALKSQLNAFTQKLAQTPNAGLIAKDRSGKVISMVILNPTPGQWTVEVNSSSNAKPYQVVASAIPRSGIPTNIDSIGRGIVDRLNKTFPRHQRRDRWGCNKCCWCQNLAGFGICVAIASAIVAGGLWAAGGILTAALLKTAGLYVSQYALYLWLAWKVPAPPGSIWDIIYGGIMDGLVNYACRLARCC
jgi:hypothetical protein